MLLRRPVKTLLHAVFELHRGRLEQQKDELAGQPVLEGDVALGGLGEEAHDGGGQVQVDVTFTLGPHLGGLTRKRVPLLPMVLILESFTGIAHVCVLIEKFVKGGRIGL